MSTFVVEWTSDHFHTERMSYTCSTADYCCWWWWTKKVSQFYYCNIFFISVEVMLTIISSFQSEISSTHIGYKIYHLTSIVLLH